MTEAMTQKLDELRKVLRGATEKKPLTARTLGKMFGVSRATMDTWIEKEAVRLKVGAVGLELKSILVRQGQRGPYSYAFWIAER